MYLQRSRTSHAINMKQVQPSHDSEIVSPTSPNRVTAHKLFITQKNIDTHLTQIQHHHGELNEYINSLEMKVKESMEKNEGQILVAYKNHMNLVKKDMEDLRKESLAQASNSNSYVETIEYLQKKLSIFRDESLKLFQKLDSRDKQMEEFKMRMDEVNKQNIYLSQSVKSLTKKNKELEIELSRFKNTDSKEQMDFEEYTQKYDISMLNHTSFRNKQYQRKNRTTITSANLSKSVNNNTIVPKHFLHSTDKIDFSHAQSDLFSKSIRGKLGYLDKDVLSEVVRVAEETFSQVQKRIASRGQTFERGKTRLEKAARVTMRSRSNYTAEPGQNMRPASSVTHTNAWRQDQRESCKLSVKQEISNYFMKCVEMIKKQIVRKKACSSLNFYKEGNPISFEQFSRLNCIKLMELAFSNQNILEGLYELLLQQKN